MNLNFARNSLRTVVAVSAAALLSFSCRAGNLEQLTDSIRTAFQMPELGFAVVKTDTIAAMLLSGFHRADQENPAGSAKYGDYFHLGSNTKAITAFIAARLVEQGKLQWTTKFFDLYPDWKKDSKSEYAEITLADLLSHRARVNAFTSGMEYKMLPTFTGSVSEQRIQFGRHLLQMNPVPQDAQPFHYSNAGYTLAALMLEKISGKTWEDQVAALFNETLHLNYFIGWPNKKSVDQPWGHWIEDGKPKPLPPDFPYDLKLAEPAGDISMPLADYSKFIQLNLKGLKGQSNVLKPETFEFLHYGRESYAMGWGNSKKDGKERSMHSGSAGTFFCITMIDRKSGQAFIVFTNIGGSLAQQGTQLLLKRLMELYKAN